MLKIMIFNRNQIVRVVCGTEEKKCSTQELKNVYLRL